MRQLATPLKLTLDDVKQHFEHWRSTRERQGKIPGSLWNEVKTLIGHYPASQIASVLRINPQRISAITNDKPDVAFVKVHPTFSSIKAIKPVSSCVDDKNGTCSIEIHRASGGILKISQLPVASLASIIHQFME